MSKQIEKIYDPKKVENKWYENWINQGYFKAHVNSQKKPYTIVIPPPNVTSILHMGHAFNNTIQDILIRYKRKTGYEALWLPGTDHAGIATQAVVERELRKTENKTRHDLGREAFLKKVWEWKEHHGSTIIEQLKKMGCSCDWDRERFTMDEGLSNAVQEVFLKLYEKGLIYKGLRIVNWDPASGTALSDDEVDHKEINGKLYHIRYKFADSNEYISVATTRPETLLGDTAVAISPEDKKKQHLIGKKVIIPFVNREVEIIVDSFVDKEFGSGFVKVTPAHDPNDFEMGERHRLPQVVILDKNGFIMQKCLVVSKTDTKDELEIPKELSGLERFEARKKIVELLDAAGQLERVENHKHAVGHSYRSHVPVEPYLSEQWFVKMKPLAKKALQEVEKGSIKFYPKGRFENTYRHWMLNIRDWCISRQLWWGHRIPAWYNEHKDVIVSADKPEKEGKWQQDNDVLDTWFSSWLWPFSTLGWPEKTEDLKYFYPTSTLVTAPDIIFFWVARMIMSGMEFMEEKPFENVFFNGLVRDEQGRKMSKSLGNGIDPLDMIEKFSADAVRFTLIMLSSEGQDLNISEKSFEIGRNFSNKLWNAFRFLNINLDNYSTDLTQYVKHFELEDRWILSRYNSTVQEVRKNIDQFRFHDALESVYHFFWGEYCDWYLEMIKPRLYRAETAEKKVTAQRVASFLMKGSMELLHAFIPFISEEIWQYFKSENNSSICVSDFPEYKSDLNDPEAEKQIEFLKEAISALRNVRAEMNIEPGLDMELVLAEKDKQFEFINDNSIHFKSLARIKKISAIPDRFNHDNAAIKVVQGTELFIPLEGLIDKKKERSRLEKELNRLQSLEQGILKKLENKNFIEKAPGNIVEGEKNKLSEIRMNLTKVKENYQKYFE